jgi:hypothetical protein
MIMPTLITVKIWWHEFQYSPTCLDMFATDIEDMMVEYDFQVDLFRFAPCEVMRNWIWDHLCREPARIEMVEIKF